MYSSRDYALARLPKAEGDWLTALAKYGPDHCITQDFLSLLNILLDWLLPYPWLHQEFGNA